MQKFTTLMLASGLVIAPSFVLHAEAVTEATQFEETTPAAPFVPFTGKITKNKVRMRVNPTLDGTIVRELSRDQLIIVLGENQDFYAIRPPADIKTYVFRTFVLDGVIEGKHVNVRLEPDTDALVVAQLNSGDRIAGEVSPINSKWLEIAPPADVRFYIAKEYVEKIGDPSMMAKIERRRNEVNQLLETAFTVSRAEMQKPYEEINLDFVYSNLERIQSEYADFHEQSGRAKALQHELKDTYMQKKVGYLENRQTSSTPITPAAEIANAIIETEISLEPAAKTSGDTFKAENPWIPNEVTLFNEWMQRNGSGTLADFYNDESTNAVALKGIVEAYTRPVRNKPGDYILVNPINKLPIAYLYSTTVDLSKYEEQEVTIKVAPRPNNNFAFPAYYVLTVE
jgi:hypothetical protein